MHVLNSGVSRTLKDSVVEMLRDDTCTTYRRFTPSCFPKTFQIVRCEFFRIVQYTSTGLLRKVEFSKGERYGTMNGLFTENDVIGMREAGDYEAVDSGSPFGGTIADRLCGLDDKN